MTRVLLVDDSPLRQSFLKDLLLADHRVANYSTPDDALEGLGHGVSVDIAVVQYRRNTMPLIRRLRNQYPAAQIIAFGSPRPVPGGVHHYLCEPVLGFEVLHLVEDIAQRSRARGHERSHTARSFKAIKVMTRAVAS